MANGGFGEEWVADWTALRYSLLADSFLDPFARKMPAETPTAAADRQNIPAGIGLMVLAVFLFSVNDALGKWLAERYQAPQIVMFRSAAALLVLVPILGRIGFRQAVTIARPRLQFGRAMLSSIEVICFYACVRYLPLADAMTYYLAGPIYVTLLAALFLGEKVGWRRWTAVFVGFVGVVIALRPTTASFGWPALIALLGSLLYACFLVITRQLRGTPDAIMAAWQMGTALVLGIIAVPFVWVTPETWYDGVLLCLLGVVGLVAIVCVNRSLKLAPASVVVPYQYLLIVWAIVFGYLVFDDVPEWPMLVGAVIIVGAGLFIFFREQRLAKPIIPEFPPDR